MKFHGISRDIMKYNETSWKYMEFHKIHRFLGFLGSARLGSARLGSARLGSSRLGSARLGLARLVRAM
jgi:hypothetical protein